jgi:glycosyltransferase involved in cell wall biosynthesis
MPFFRSKKKPATFAILMRTRDRALFLPRAIESVLAQTFTDWNLVLVNDGGNMGQLENAIAPFRERLGARLVLVNHEKSGGIGASLNRAIRASESDLLVVHDDDDSWQPEFLAESRRALEDPAFGACVSRATMIYESVAGSSITEVRREIYNEWQNHQVSLFRLAEGNTIAPISLVFRRSVLEKIGMRRDEFGPLEDWEFNLRLFSNYPVAFIPKVLANYHQRVQGSNQGTQANFFASSSDLYGKLDIEIRNEFLRRDLAEGRLGLGYLVSLGSAHGQLFQKADSITQAIRDLGNC